MDFYYLPGKRSLRKECELVLIEIYVGSAPCRAVQMTTAAVGANLNLKRVNLQAGEHLTPEYIKVKLISPNFYIF